MVNTSSDGIMSEYLVKYAIIRSSGCARPTELLETLHMTERFRAGEDLRPLRHAYDISVWNGVLASDIERRLAVLDQYMHELAEHRRTMWVLN